MKRHPKTMSEPELNELINEEFFQGEMPGVNFYDGAEGTQMIRDKVQAMDRAAKIAFLEASDALVQ